MEVGEDGAQELHNDEFVGGLAHYRKELSDLGFSNIWFSYNQFASAPEFDVLVTLRPVRACP
jgi:hypothetical protein